MGAELAMSTGSLARKAFIILLAFVGATANELALGVAILIVLPLFYWLDLHLDRKGGSLDQ